MSYNIKYDNKNDTLNNWQDRKHKIIDLLKQYNPSVFGIQEGLKNQVEFIDNSLANYAYVGIGREGKKKGEYSAIFYDLTKVELTDNGTFWLSKTPDFISRGWDAALNRICTYALFKNLVTKKQLWIFNTHFDHIGKLARENSAKLILAKIEKLNIQNFPVILMGDFNATTKEKPIQILTSQLNDAVEIAETPLKGSRGTFNGFNMRAITKRIDYFFTDKLVVKSYTHIDDTLSNKKHISDHLPIMIVIKN
ncbi:MAG: endonuclease/exonuclease/phosphatase [Lutibacter sp.]|nr:MAG: endonuclease/exonuclease/phosphatase [Lutibacter sp.]